MAPNDHLQSDGNTRDDGASAPTFTLDLPPQLPPLAPFSSEPSQDPNSLVHVQSETAPHDNTITDATDVKPAAGNESVEPVASPPASEPTAAPTAQASTEESNEPKAPEVAQESKSPVSDTSAKEDEDSGPSLLITLLLITGARHPFKIDGKYLKKQSVNVENNDPFAMSVYTLKELIWKGWRPEWEPRPASPTSIRLISFGKLLDDKAPLSDSKFNHDAPNVVHMTVKPPEVIEDEDTKGTKGQYPRDREGSQRSPGCRCVIM
ncbi:uncharacterized protein KD926_005082 [Aspergillus affinis]|uniref:uncharacterized protein n=1 Tax=Aspergillus affinis TaxID=1070780 RepID=UPI0022FF32EB|nr:uncharacterized protein KD926_005082 [Aspergillus affinis]KAI9042752.1 hypothetical protein KD926_005082 [Aspergillus affinis]